MALRIYKRGLIASSFRKVIPRTSIQEAAYGATLLLLLMLNEARKSVYKNNKMKKILFAVCCTMLFVSCQKEVENELVGTKWSRQFSSFLYKTSIVLEFTSNTELVYYLMMDDEPSDPKSATYTLTGHNITFDELSFTWVNTYTFKSAKYTASVMMVEGTIRDGNGISDLSWNLAKQ